MSLYRIIYVSAAQTPFGADELFELLRKSRQKNERLGITGMLLYKGENFIQVLEGPEQAVKDLFNTISTDKRHRAIIALAQEPIEKREFGDWSMSFTNISTLTEQDMPGISKFLEEPMTPESLSQNPSRARVLLETFREIMP